jgi:hypothetical protein
VVTKSSPMADQYTVLERVGEGTFGEVHKARDAAGNIVAMKRVRLRDTESGGAEACVVVACSLLAPSPAACVGCIVLLSLCGGCGCVRDCVVCTCPCLGRDLGVGRCLCPCLSMC